RTESLYLKSLLNFLIVALLYVLTLHTFYRLNIVLATLYQLQVVLYHKNVSIYVLFLHQIFLLLRIYFYLASHHSDVHLNAKFYKRESIIDESVSTINKLFQSLLLIMKYRQHLFLFLVLIIFPLTISLR